MTPGAAPKAVPVPRLPTRSRAPTNNVTIFITFTPSCFFGSMDLANPVLNRAENENGLIIAMVKELTGCGSFALRGLWRRPVPSNGQGRRVFDKPANLSGVVPTACYLHHDSDSALRLVYGNTTLQQDGLSHCSKSGARRRVAEHPDYSGRPTRVHAVRPVSESLNIAPNTLPPVERAGSCGRFRAPPL